MFLKKKIIYIIKIICSISIKKYGLYLYTYIYYKNKIFQEIYWYVNFNWKKRVNVKKSVCLFIYNICKLYICNDQNP